jgi:hypothetical protein
LKFNSTERWFSCQDDREQKFNQKRSTAIDNFLIGPDRRPWHPVDRLSPHFLTVLGFQTTDFARIQGNVKASGSDIYFHKRTQSTVSNCVSSKWDSSISWAFTWCISITNREILESNQMKLCSGTSLLLSHCDVRKRSQSKLVKSFQIWFQSNLVRELPLALKADTISAVRQERLLKYFH